MTIKSMVSTLIMITIVMLVPIINDYVFNKRIKRLEKRIEQIAEDAEMNRMDITNIMLDTELAN